MKRTLGVVAIASVLITGACYRATVDLALVPSDLTIEQSWAACWIFGLVPPKTVTTASKCPDGVAKVETKLGFWNQVVGALTLGVYTPMHITVTCAATPTAFAPMLQPELVVPEHATEDQVVGVFQAAGEQAVVRGRAVFVRF